MQYVFVYGTLRAGEANDINHAAARNGIATPEWIGAAHVRGQLFDFGNYPGLVIDEKGAPIRGDVYRIEDALVPCSTRSNMCIRAWKAYSARIACMWRWKSRGERIGSIA